jgi:hypothetical protein
MNERGPYWPKHRDLLRTVGRHKGHRGARELAPRIISKPECDVAVGTVPELDSAAGRGEGSTTLNCVPTISGLLEGTELYERSSDRSIDRSIDGYSGRQPLEAKQGHHSSGRSEVGTPRQRGELIILVFTSSRFCNGARTAQKAKKVLKAAM